MKKYFAIRNSNTLATWCEELTHLKRPWCWGRLRAGEEGDNRGWDGWMASPTQWTWVCVNCGSWWWTGRPGVLQSTGLQRVGHDWATELNFTCHTSLKDEVLEEATEATGSSLLRAMTTISRQSWPNSFSQTFSLRMNFSDETWIPNLSRKGQCEQYNSSISFLSNFTWTLS